jgi:uncharacterized alpha-E superfamily protein
MLLSRVAESVYWAGRYLERAEATARLVKVHTELFLDLPAMAGVGWSPLLAVTGTREAFDEHYNDAIEEDVIRFLTSDAASPTSILSSLTSARYNFRVTRNVLPASAWEQLNQLYLWVVQSRTLAVDRRTRLACMDRVIRDCYLLRGLLAGTMSHDEAYWFLEIGSLVERADMTTRVLDVQAGVLMQDGTTATANSAVEAYSDITWVSVLRSLSAQQMFRRAVHSGITGQAALKFLLRDPQFPRSVEHCLTRISRALLELPHYDEAMVGCAKVQQLLVDSDINALSSESLHHHMDDLQIGIGGLHTAITETYFVRASDNAVIEVASANGALATA